MNNFQNMKTTLICRRFYDTLTSTAIGPGARLTVAPDRPRSQNYPEILVLHDAVSTEIVCFKSTSMQIFKEAHSLLYGCESEMHTNDFEDIYLATVGLLFITPEDRTNLNRHVSLLLRYLHENAGEKWISDETAELFLGHEMQLLTLYLTSNLNRVNKSSSLWLLFRKLHVLRAELFPKLNFDFWILFTRSATCHFSNYYCWNSLRWLFDVQTVEVRSSLLKLTRDFCFANPKDSSAWWTLQYMLRNCPNAQQFSVSHFNDLRHEFGFKPTSFALTALDIDYERYFDDILEFIDYAEVKEWPPFLCLESLLFRMPHKWKNARFKKWWQDIRSFEAEQFEIAIESPIRLSHTGTFENDLLLQRLAASLVLKKKLLSSKLT